jgi:hypothetical protein
MFGFPREPSSEQSKAKVSGSPIRSFLDPDEGANWSAISLQNRKGTTGQAIESARTTIQDTLSVRLGAPFEMRLCYGFRKADILLPSC